MRDEPLAARLSAPQTPPGAPDADMRTLIARAEARLKAHPEDGRGWDVLAPIYLRLNRRGDAVGAFRNAIRILGAERAARRRARRGADPGRPVARSPTRRVRPSRNRCRSTPTTCLRASSWRSTCRRRTSSQRPRRPGPTSSPPARRMRPGFRSPTPPLPMLAGSRARRRRPRLRRCNRVLGAGGVGVASAGSLARRRSRWPPPPRCLRATGRR